MIIVSGSASNKLSKSLAEVTESKMAEVEIRRFPDGECYVRIHSDVSGENVVIVQSTYPDPNAVELFLLVDAVKESGSKKITVVVPYYGYARQDKRFETGEGISARAMAKHLSLDIDAVITVDIHSPYTLEYFKVPVRDVSGMPALAQRLKEEGIDMILSPDKGAVKRAEAAANIVGCPWDHMEKTRLDGETVMMKAKSLDVDGKTVAIVDDIIATGGTMITASEHLRQQGAKRILAACTHGLYTSNALPRLQKSFDMVLSTDTLETETAGVSVAGEVAKAL